MAKKKLNCWEYMECGRQPGGVEADIKGVCPAAREGSPFCGYNQGAEAGRICWLVAGTFCNNIVQGSFADKRDGCKNCSFYKQVNSEEGITKLPSTLVDIFAVTHIGRVRKNNEDRYFVKRLKDKSILLAIADGLGGEVAGDYAAELLRGKLSGVESIPQGNEQEHLEKLALEIDQAILTESEKDKKLEGMGTTFIGVLLRKKMAYWVHVGDSRLYHCAERELSQVTRDHNFARYLIDEGDITIEEAMTHPSRFHLDQCIGQGFCEPDTGEFSVALNDILLLSTDGLHTQVTIGTMHANLFSTFSLEAKAKALVKAALDAGGDDNIALVIAQIVN